MRGGRKRGAKDDVCVCVGGVSVGLSVGVDVC